MCGIVGVLSKHQIRDRIPLERMRDALTHRGPDNAGIWWSQDGVVGLGHRRLSVIDLSPLGHQPMSEENSCLHIVFNGEIYNYLDLKNELISKGYQFKSRSDTEVLLKAYREWGESFLKRLNGMFAIAIYDEKRQTLLLARDRAGEKPLFYGIYNDRFVFASELKAIMADPEFERRLNKLSLEYYLTFSYVPRDLCILEKIHKLPPAHFLIFDLATFAIRVRPFWALPAQTEVNQKADEELEEDLEFLINDSVRRQLVSDVPVGIMLSGGVDSSVVTALVTRISPTRIRTFTVGFPGFGVFDERSYARTVAGFFGTDHTELIAEPATVDLLPELAAQYDEPMCDSSMIPTYLVSRLVRKHCTVALTGDGGDELFGGYTSYQWALRQERLKARILPKPLCNVLAWMAQNGLPIGFRGRNYVMGLAGGPAEALTHNSLNFDRNFRLKLCPWLQKKEFKTSPIEHYKISLYDISRHLPGSAMALDFLTYLPEDLLVKMDRASMLASLEVRAPLLDYRIIEFAFSSVPDRLRATLEERKILMRRLARKLLPPELDLRRKRGFSIPLRAWFKGKWGYYIADVLDHVDPDLFSRKAIQTLIRIPKMGIINNSESLFGLTIFELWRKHYKIQL